MQNTRPTPESLFAAFALPPDITIEYVKPPKSETLNLSNHHAIEDEDEIYDDCYEDFNPLVFCAITMDDDDKRDDTPYMNGMNVDDDSVTTNKLKKSTTRITQSNENSSFVCNGATQPAGKVRKRFSCSFCPKTFGWTTDLKRHILIHTGERPFKCSLCSATFTRNFLLQKHKTKIHQCLSPNEVTQLNSKVAENVMEIKQRMKELEEAKSTSLEIAEEKTQTGTIEVCNSASSTELGI